MLFTRRLSTTLISIGLCCSLAGYASQVLAIEPATVAVSLGEFLFDKLSNHVQEHAARVEGRVETRSLREDLRRYAEHHREHAEKLRRLERELNETMSPDEIHELLRTSLAEVDEHLARLADKLAIQERRMAEQSRSLKLQEAQLRALKQSIQEVEQRHDELLVDQQKRLMSVEIEMSRLHSETLKPQFDKRAAELGHSGMAALSRGDYLEAHRNFELGHSISPKDAGFAYGVAMALQRLGDEPSANATFDKAVITERWYGRPQRWFNLALERLDNGDKVWMFGRRFDPASGVRVRGEAGWHAKTAASASGRLR